MVLEASTEDAPDTPKPLVATTRLETLAEFVRLLGSAKPSLGALPKDTLLICRAASACIALLEELACPHGMPSLLKGRAKKRPFSVFFEYLTLKNLN